MEDCQFPTNKIIQSVQIKSKNNVAGFFCISRIVHYEFVPTGRTVNQVYYLEVLGRLREKVRRKGPELFAINSWILHHDNAPAHTALSVREFLAARQITVLEHPAIHRISPPVTFFSVPKDKGNIERKTF